jgi:hypothetical protein
VGNHADTLRNDLGSACAEKGALAAENSKLRIEGRSLSGQVANLTVMSNHYQKADISCANSTGHIVY